MKVFDKTWKLAVAGALVGCAGSIAGVFWKSGQYGDLYCVLRT